ncbi:TetR/AcrR family transcriptional regulator [Maritimibacter sp. HL-12]|jgi:AcrR family transcriptional regulator|uniref:TetR/AcrR family transcriptional regulator n=1 Tax=Maritimibacter sp. HL-12 TaxID=1162418 RepID=UPI000A0F3E13|nr:TetR/AcrR family transcriptional regulator [Maritimibacter sp. HL-12]SMH48790.1 transcriptional regulator, TetR family [Maritimibacter sp. HL-12]
MTTDDSPTPKFRRRAEHRPDELLDAALALFVEKGYAHTSVAQIARTAGVSKGAVYLYFPSKQAILEGLVKRAVRPVSTAALTLLRGHPGNTRAALSGFLHQLAERLADPKTTSVPRLVLREAAAAPEIAEMYRREILAPTLPVLADMIRQGIASGEVRPVDPELTIRSLMGPIIAHLLLAEVFGVQPAAGLSLPALIDNHLDILFHGLLVPPELPRDA